MTMQPGQTMPLKNANADPDAAPAENMLAYNDKSVKIAQEIKHTPGVLLYEGKPYAVGLLWLTVQEDNLKVLLNERLKKTKADFYCHRIHISQQHGFGWLDKGHRRGMKVAAAMVADQLVGEWHGVFEADNGWWYVQVRSDTITPNGDRFFASEEEAYNLFHEEMVKHNWPHAYAPSKWNLSDGSIRELLLKDLVDNFSTTTLIAQNITALFGGKARRNLVLGVLGAIVAGMAGILLMTLLQEPEVIQPLPMPARPLPVLAVAPPKVETLDAVSPLQLLQNCYQLAGQLFLSLPGWTPDTFSCDRTTATMSWRQGSGSLNDAKTTGLQHWPQQVGISFSQNILTASLPQTQLPTLQQSDLLPQEGALLALEQNLQPLGAVTVKPVTPPPVPPVPNAVKAPPPPPLPYLDITLNSGFGMDALGPQLDLPGLELLSVKWLISQSTWTYQLKITHMRPKSATATPAVKTAVPAATDAVKTTPPVTQTTTAPQAKPVQPAKPQTGEVKK